MTRGEGDRDDQSTSVIEREGALRILPVELVVVEGADRGKRTRVPHGTAKVGTGAGAQLCLADRTVSRLHCEVAVRPGGVAVRDLESTNGTFVDGHRIRDIDVVPGALVRVGETTFRVEVGSEPEFVELSTRSSFAEVVGSSVEMRRLYAILEKVAPTEATVLIQGETGTGKELVAQGIHESSRRASGPFVTVDCGAIPENLMESELFGHVRGAFTGAIADRSGAFEEANGGTLFLDEIGELPLALQPKLLRALEARQIRRVGSNQPRPIDLRIVAATNRSLARSVNEGMFREDLYYRLAVVEARLPPLRARRDDIPLLAAHFLERFTGAPAKLPAATTAALMTRGWPGNVRELRNYIERSVSLGWPTASASGAEAGDRVLPQGLASLVPVHLGLKEARLAWIEQFESVYVRALLEKTGGNVSRAAALAGVSRRFLQRLMSRTGVRSGDAGAGGDEEER